MILGPMGYQFMEKPEFKKSHAAFNFKGKSFKNIITYNGTHL